MRKTESEIEGVLIQDHAQRSALATYSFVRSIAFSQSPPIVQVTDSNKVEHPSRVVHILIQSRRTLHACPWTVGTP